MLTLMDHELQLSRSLSQDLYETSHFVLTFLRRFTHRRSSRFLNEMSTIVSETINPKGAATEEHILYLPLFNRYLAYSLAWLSGVDIFNRTFYVERAFNVLRSAVAKGGIIFTDAQSFQHILNPNAFKYKALCVTRILQLRSKTPCGPFNDVLAKIAAVLDPSSCLLALGTWQLPITLTINALRSNALPAAATILSPLLSIPSHVWEDWVAAIAASQARPYCAILEPVSGLDVISLILGVCYYWTPPF
ncbi:MAG: hypothetical protein ACTS53_01885 [Candidatus Hodgkinia cicadicola]